MTIAGRTDSGSTVIEWAMPEYSDAQRRLCSVGLHRLTRKRVVWGYINYFTDVERWYCACGVRCFIRFEGSFVEEQKDELGGHLNWINGHVLMEQKMALHREQMAALR